MKPTILQVIREQVERQQRQKAACRWQDELRRLKLEDIKKRTPAAFEASGGYNMLTKPYSDKTTNGLTKCILDFLNFSGHWAVRINVQGQARIKRTPKFNIISGKMEYREKVHYTKSTTKRGTPDINSIIFGRSVQIEVKAGKDRLRDVQIGQGTLIEEAGGIWYVATNMPDFLEFYNSTFKKK